MAAAVITACSGLSFSRMSRINSALFSVIINFPLHIKRIILKSQHFSTIACLSKLYNDCKRKSISEFAVFIGKFTV